MNAAELERRLLYRDGLMLVIDKPPGMPVHAGPGGGDNLERHFGWLRFGLPRKPEAAHRLDKDTSGCLVLGRHPRAMAELNQMFRDGRIDKTYWAICEGGPAEDQGLIDLALGKQSPERGWWMKPDPSGQPALTRWRVLGRADRATLMELRPITGRTHQLRVHCAASGWPILGDPIYGAAPRFSGPGLHLHARTVTVPLYRKKPPIVVEAPLPAAMRDGVAACTADMPREPG